MHDQIADRCIHFNGVMERVCKAGVSYADVRVGKPYQFPCLKQAGFCMQCKFPTAEEVAKELAEINKFGESSLKAFLLVKSHYQKTKQQTGTIKCECGGDLKFSVSVQHNHLHVAAKCSSCGVYFNGH